MVLRFLLLGICLVFGSISLVWSSQAMCDKVSLTAAVDGSTPPLEDDTENVMPGGAVPFDQDDFKGFELGACDSALDATHLAPSRDVGSAFSLGEDRLGPASGYAHACERPPRFARG